MGLLSEDRFYLRKLSEVLNFKKGRDLLYMYIKTCFMDRTKQRKKYRHKEAMNRYRKYRKDNENKRREERKA